MHQWHETTGVHCMSSVDKHPSCAWLPSSASPGVRLPLAMLLTPPQQADAPIRRNKCPHLLGRVGAGSGVLAIAALLLGASRAAATDVDPLAVRAAGANAALNGVTERLVAVPCGHSMRVLVSTGSDVSPCVHRSRAARCVVLQPRGRLLFSDVCHGQCRYCLLSSIRTLYTGCSLRLC